MQGLTQREAAARLLRYGPNELADQHAKSGVLAFFLRFQNPLIIILLVSALVSGFLNDRVSATIIIVIILVSVLLDSINTYKSEKAVAALRDRIRLHTLVRRDGKTQSVALNTIVPGDVAELQAGNIIPADGKVLEAKDLFINESALTGESFPQARAVGDTLHMGSSLVSGTAVMLVETTGQTTRYGHIAQSLAAKEPVTEFDREIQDFSRLIMHLTTGLVVFIFIITLVLRHSFLTSLMFSLALAVGLTPSLLPLIITLNLTKGSLLMARHGVIVKRLSAIQNFGSMDVLCTDKTGTLTEDKIELVKYIDGSGKTSEDVFRYAYLASFHTKSFSSPLDKAIKSYKTLDITTYHKRDEIPFDFERKRDSVVVEHEKKDILITKGAPEQILTICRHYLTPTKVLTPAERKKIHDLYESLSRDGFRVLAVAVKKVAPQAAYEPTDETDLTFQGFIAFLDPPKKTVTATLQHMEQHGVEIKVVTGDNLLVSQKIANEINLPVKGVLTGAEIDRLTDAALLTQVEKITIFARVTPEQKLRIIESIKKRGHVVGYMGDGINDAPSLKAADVGISVDNAVDVAKSSADFILLHKSLADLMNGVIEGRKIFANTLKYLMMALSSNFGNMFSMAGAAVILPFLPMLPVQILFNNLLYDVSQFAIPLDAVDIETLQRPHRLNVPSIKQFMWIFGLTSSLFDFITFSVLYKLFHFGEFAFQTGWFLESLATQTLVVYIIRTRKIPFVQSWPGPYLLVSTLSVLVLSFIVVFTPLGRLFHFVPLAWQSVGVLAVIVVVYLITVESVKKGFDAWSTDPDEVAPSSGSIVRQTRVRTALPKENT